MFDLPWAPIYILVIFALASAARRVRLRSAVLLILMALLNEWLVSPPLTESNEAASRNYAFTEMSLRNWEVVQAMGMMGGLLQRWGRDRNRMLERQVTASDRAATMQSIIRFLAPLDAVGHPRAWRLSGDRAARHGRRDVCGQHPARPRAAAGRADRRLLAQPGWRAQRLSCGSDDLLAATSAARSELWHCRGRRAVFRSKA